MTDELKLKISNKLKEMKLVSPNKGKKMPPQVKEALLRTRPKIMSEESRYKLSQSTGYLILDTVTGVYYIGLSEAAKAKNIVRGTLKNKIRNPLNNSGLIYV